MRSKRSSHAVSNSSGDTNDNKAVQNKHEYRDRRGRAVYGHEVADSLAFKDNANFDDDNNDSNSDDDDDDYSTSSSNSIDASKQACKDVEDIVSILGGLEFTGATVNMDAAKIPDGSRLIDK
ncbi:hypothetical protein BO83DRAFT_425722 [Aspergillus eucalypticola CBS 122712]|uniref:Uncharacterized protein n=1 Tax=Aspergillus eucalypticola (strain CBS 122712 / IBT 29274) TaxID=1448314 RepID=A0A317VTB8_ASPEC|nr:uncharacterized protein BO83DRAFT_425722 [Aspergillus eucalypticola CBS 122712]PWY76809.1 hypothetical protein BO83DRAFT_425722 [Aspergillus eucalypticola CBS 122712]